MTTRLAIVKSKNRSLATVAIVSGTFGSVLGSTVINVPLRDIANDLHVSITTSTLLVTLSGITFATLLPLGGWLGNRYGRRNVFCLATGILAAAGLVAMLAQSFATLVAMRIIQGAVSAAIVPIVMTILADLYEPERRAVGLSAWATANSLGQALGPPLGGILASAISWRAAFAPATVVSAAACIAAWQFVPHDPPTPSRLEWRGALGLTLGSGSLLTAITILPQMGVASPVPWVLVIVAALGLGYFRFAINSAEQPFVAPQAFHEPSYVLSMIAILAATVAMGATLLGVPLYLTHVLHYSTLSTGFVVLALPLAMVLAAPFSSGLVGRVGSATTVRGALIALALGSAAIASIVMHGWSVGLLAAFLVIVGIAIALAYTGTAVESTRSAAGRYGAGVGLYNVLRIGGSAAGAALVALVLQHQPLAYGSIFAWCTGLLVLAIPAAFTLRVKTDTAASA